MDLAPLTRAAGAIGRIYLNAGAMRAINDVAPAMHPELERIAGVMKQDLAFADVIARRCAGELILDMELVLEETRAAPASARFDTYRTYAARESALRARASGSGRTARALDAMLKAHGDIVDGPPADAERSISAVPGHGRGTGRVPEQVGGGR